MSAWRITLKRPPLSAAAIAAVGVGSLLLWGGLGSCWAAKPVAKAASAAAASRIAPDEPVRLQLAAQAATQAREACYPKIHHDTVLFEGCVRDHMDRAESGSAQQLGVAYFGWVGAMNSARMGMTGAADTATRFLNQFTPLQTRHRVSDLALCQTIPGDCTVRVAQLEAQRNAPRPVFAEPYLLKLPADMRGLIKPH